MVLKEVGLVRLLDHQAKCSPPVPCYHYALARQEYVFLTSKSLGA